MDFAQLTGAMLNPWSQLLGIGEGLDGRVDKRYQQRQHAVHKRGTCQKRADGGGVTVRIRAQVELDN